MSDQFWCVCRKYCKGVRRELDTANTWRQHLREADEDEKDAIRLAGSSRSVVFRAFLDAVARPKSTAVNDLGTAKSAATDDGGMDDDAPLPEVPVGHICMLFDLNVSNGSFPVNQYIQRIRELEATITRLQKENATLEGACSSIQKSYDTLVSRLHCVTINPTAIETSMPSESSNTQPAKRKIEEELADTDVHSVSSQGQSEPVAKRPRPTFESSDAADDKPIVLPSTTNEAAASSNAGNAYTGSSSAIDNSVAINAGSSINKGWRPALNKTGRTLCAYRWLKQVKSDGSKDEFDAYYEALSEETKALYKEEATKLVASRAWSGGTARIVAKLAALPMHGTGTGEGRQ